MEQITDDILKGLGFKHHETNQFNVYNMAYFVKRGICLFYNDPVFDDPEKKYLIGYAEMRAGNYYAITIDWTNNLDRLKEVFKVITGHDISEPV